MENDSDHCHCYYLSPYGREEQQLNQIVEHQTSNYPILLRWLRHLRLMLPVNNSNYNPTLPAA